MTKRGGGGVATTLRPYVTEVRGEAVRSFDERYPGLQFAPAVVVIAAYDEEGAIGAVVDAVPAEAGHVKLDTLVIDDGSADRTTAVALEHGAHVATLRRNCGHGVALRLGYELAREHGASTSSRWTATASGIRPTSRACCSRCSTTRPIS